MAYTPTVWANDVSPDIDATNLNHIETGISDAHTAIDQMSDPGDVKMVGYAVVAGVSEPSGWLLCDGRAVSRTTYSALWDKVGITHGPGDGSTTFNLPDGRGKSPMGAGTGSGLTARTLGSVVGTETHTLTVAQMPAHAHGGATGAGTSGTSAPVGSTDSQGSHTHGTSDGGLYYGSGGSVIFNTATSGAGAVRNQGMGAAGAHSHNVFVNSHAHSVPALGISSEGSGGSHPNVHPCFVLNFLIKT